MITRGVSGLLLVIGSRMKRIRYLGAGWVSRLPYGGKVKANMKNYILL